MGANSSKNQDFKKFSPNALSLLAEDWTTSFKLPPKRITICPVCFHQRNCKGYWCQNCESRRFKEAFPTWTSGNREIDEFIRETQLNSVWWAGYLEWIPYNRFQNIKFIARGGFGSIYYAIWVDGPRWEYVPNAEGLLGSMWKRKGAVKVALKMLDNSKGLNNRFLNEVKSMLFYSFCHSSSPSLPHSLSSSFSGVLKIIIIS